jgi:multidrug efflux pump subunit AcrA (membrane-fusion protein)
MVHVVVEVPDPYGRGEDADRPPLAVGLFVEADIRGRVADNVVVLPRRALRGEDRVWLVDADDRLRSCEIDVLRTERERVLVAGGLEVGMQVVVSPLSTPVEGMRVQVFRPAHESAALPVEVPIEVP